MKKLLVFLLFFLTQGAFCKEQLTLSNNIPPIALESLTQYARNNRSDIQASRSATEQKKAYEYATLAQHFPQISLSVITQKSENGTLPEQQLQLSLAQQVFAPATVYLPYQLARVGTDTSNIQTELQQNSVQLEVEQSFFQKQTADQQKKLGTAISLSAPALFEKAATSFTIGLISAVEFEQYKTDYESALSSLKQISEGAKIAQNKLKLATEQTKIKNLVWISAPQLKRAIQIALGYKPQVLLENSYQKRPDLRLLDSAARQAELQNILYQSSYLPTASIFANMYATKKSSTILSTAESLINYPWVVGINFSWNFDSLSNMFHARGAHADYLAQILKKKRAEWSTKEEISSSLHQLNIDKKQLEAAQQTYQAGKKRFEQQQVAASAGLIASTEFLAAQTAWEQVQFEYAQQTTSAGNNYALFNFRTGNQLPLTNDIIPAYQGYKS